MAINNRITKRNLYLNTTVFCLLAGVFSALLLLLLLYGGDVGSQLTVFVITAECGIMAVVIYALVQVVRAERRARRLAQNKADNLIAVTTCPDYYTQMGEDTCYKAYRAPARQGGTDGSSTIFAMPGAKDKVSLTAFNKMPLRKLCTMVNDQQAPWTDVQSVCSANNM